MKAIHAVGHAGQGDIQIFCSGDETEVKWGSGKTSIPFVYLTETDLCYTYDETLVTCPECLSKLGMRGETR